MSLTDPQIAFYFGQDAVQKRYDYDAQGMITFNGYATAGAEEDEPVWVIIKSVNAGVNGSPSQDIPFINVRWDQRNVL